MTCSRTAFEKANEFVDTLKNSSLWALDSWYHFEPYTNEAEKFSVYTLSDNGEVVCFGIVGHYPQGFMDYYNDNILDQFQYSLEWMQTKKDCTRKGHATALLKEIRNAHPRMICLAHNDDLLFLFKRGAFPIVGEAGALTERCGSYVCFHENDDLTFKEATEIYGEHLDEHECDYEVARAVQHGVIAEKEKELLSEEYPDRDINSFSRAEVNILLYD